MNYLILRILTILNLQRLIFCASPFGYRHGDYEEESNSSSTSTTVTSSSISASPTSTTTMKTVRAPRRLKFQDSRTFFSSYFHGNGSDEDDIDQDDDMLVDTMTIGSSIPFTGNETKYIRISSSIEIPESESLILIMDAVKLLWNAGLESIKKGFFPTMERVRRDTSAVDSEKGFILDWIIDLIGAVINRQEVFNI